MLLLLENGLPNANVILILLNILSIAGNTKKMKIDKLQTVFGWQKTAVPLNRRVKIGYIILFSVLVLFIKYNFSIIIINISETSFFLEKVFIMLRNTLSIVSIVTLFIFFVLAKCCFYLFLLA